MVLVYRNYKFYFRFTLEGINIYIMKNYFKVCVLLEIKCKLL